MDYQKRQERPIPIGKQDFAYQCEDVFFDYLKDAVFIKGYKPSGRGKQPYPNEEIDLVEEYELKISQFTSNGIEVVFKKKYRDGRTGMYLNTISFSDLVNRLFEGHPSNSWTVDAPLRKQFSQ